MAEQTAQLGPQRILEEALKLLHRERGRASNLGYPPTFGSSLPPMSTLEQRRQELQHQFREKGVPYGGKVQRALARGNEGLPTALQTQLLAQQEAAQRQFGEGNILPMLRSQFGASYGPREAAFRGLTEGDTRRGLGEMRGTLADIQRGAGTLQERQNLETAKVMQALGQSKGAQREQLVGALDQAAKQKHAIGAMQLSAQKAAREEEALAPQKRLELLEAALRGPMQSLTGAEVHPDITRQQGLTALRALQAAGVDIAKPPSQWAIEKPASVYRGQRVATTPAEMERAWETLERLRPNLKETRAPQRKALTEQALTAPAMGEVAAQRIPEALRGRIETLEHDARERLRKDIGAISQHYISLGQYGSPQHQKATEERAQELNKAVLQQRNTLLGGQLGQELGQVNEERLGGLRQLLTHGEERRREVGELMGNIQGMGKTGEAKFKSRQEELEELYRNYQNENLWQWPHMRGQAQNQAMRSVLGGIADAGVGFPEELARLQTGYNSLEQERNRFGSELERERAQHRTTHEANQALRQQSDQRQAAAAAAAQAQWAAQQAQQTQWATQQAQMEAARRAAEQAEAQRLRSIAPQESRQAFNTDRRLMDYRTIAQYLSALPMSGLSPLQIPGRTFLKPNGGQDVGGAYQHAQGLHRELMHHYPQQMTTTPFGAGTFGAPLNTHITNTHARQMLGI